MKILLVSDAFPPSFGGVERHVHTLSKYLNNKGHDVTILTEASTENDEEIIKSGLNLRREIKFEKRTTALQWTYHYIQNSKKIKEVISKEGAEYDLVHYHGTHILYMDKIHIQKPLIATIHGIFPSCIAFWGIENWCGDNPSALNCAICMTRIRNYYIPFLPGMILYNKYYLDRMKKSLHSLNRIISVSDYVKNIVEKSFNLDNIITLYNFIDIKDGINAYVKDDTKVLDEYGLNDTDKIILFSGRLHSQKGILTLLESFKKLKDADLKLIISGKGELEDAVIKASKENSNIQFLGYLSREVQINILNKCDLFVAPSTYPDACPTSILEAMALGKPVISTSLGGIPELIVDGKTGYLIEPNNPELLALKIHDILQMGTKYYKDECIQQAQQFDINNVGKTIINLYETLIK